MSQKSSAEPGGGAIPEAEDGTLFGLAIAGASALRAIERLRRYPRPDARPAGHESRQMIATTETAASAVLSPALRQPLAYVNGFR